MEEEEEEILQGLQGAGFIGDQNGSSTSGEGNVFSRTLGISHGYVGEVRVKYTYCLGLERTGNDGAAGDILGGEFMGDQGGCSTRVGGLFLSGFRYIRRIRKDIRE